MHLPKRFAATLALIRLLQSEPGSKLGPTVKTLNAWWSIAVPKLLAEQIGELSVPELIAARIAIRVVIEDEPAAQDVVLAGLCIAHLPLFGPDQIRAALLLDLEAFSCALQLQAERADALAALAG